MISLPNPNIRRALRTGANVTLAELAESLGVATATCFYWERGAQPRSTVHRNAYRELLREWANELSSGIETLSSNGAGTP